MMRALDLAIALEAGDISPRAVIELAFEAHAAAGKDAHVFALVDFDRARLIAARLAPTQGLFGLPFGVKDIIDTAALPTQHGSALYRDHQPKSDAAIVVMTEDAGGIMLGKTVTTEFAFLNPAATTNPFDETRTPGGSSSGSAAGVARGILPLAFGTQTGGSMIRPASYCGVAAIKPGFGFLPMAGVKPFAPSLDTLGLYGARVVDIAFGLGAITGRDLRVDEVDYGVPTFGVTRQGFAGAAEPEAEAALQAAIRAVEAAGAKVIDLDLPGVFAEAYIAHRVINNAEGALSLAFEHRRHREALSPILLDALDDGLTHLPETYDSALMAGAAARRAMPTLFADCDVLLTYAAPGVAPARSSTGEARFNKLFTLLGLPAVAVPGWRSAEGLPVNVQVVGPPRAEHHALAAADFVERALAKSL